MFTVSKFIRNSPLLKLAHIQKVFQSAMSSEDYTLPNKQPVIVLECSTAFNALTKKEKLYAHYLNQACWTGSLIVLLQTSPESPVIFTLLHKIFSEENIEELKKNTSSQVSEDEFQAFLVYASGLFANMGNYKGFGDSKFIPNLPAEKFEAIIKASSSYGKSPEKIESLWQKCRKALYSITDQVKNLGVPEKGVTTYFSSNFTEKYRDELRILMKKHQIEAYNTRTILLKTPKVYQVILASVDTGTVQSVCEEEYNCDFEIVRGDYSPLLSKVNENLLKAKEYASNDNEVKMLNEYVKSFKTGSLDQHKEGSRYWIKNQNPIIETYIGFIETYRDPLGSRGEFEGFVAMVNKEMSKKFSQLVDEAENILLKLPWSREFEKNEFRKPDFTSLDVLTYAGSGIPCGINIPNYDEIRQNDGFKNVSLGNMIPCGFKDHPFPFLSPEDKDLVTKYAVPAFEVQVGLHELLGHGSGKLFHKSKSDLFDFDHESVINPLTGKLVSSWYEDGETYDSKFSALSSAYEECRAECVGLYLSLFPDVVRIFVNDPEEVEKVTYVNWLLLIVSGTEKALEMYQPLTETWLQAHSQARFVISRVLLEANAGLLTVTESVPNEKLLINLDKTKLHTVGSEAIKEFLLKLQIHKSTANIEEAEKLFNKYSKVTNEGAYPWLRWRDIVLKHKQPRKIFVQSNTFVEGDDVVLKTYEPTVESFIKSWVDRFSEKEYFHEALIELATKDEPYFKY